jgi:hypothetical protein
MAVAADDGEELSEDELDLLERMKAGAGARWTKIDECLAVYGINVSSVIL